MLPWILCGVFFVTIIVMFIKIVLLKKSMEEICTEFRDRLSTDTNTLISISSSDRHAKKLTSEINEQLRLLRKQRRLYITGDMELKEAINNISHDLRTPLTAICGYLDLLEQEQNTEDVKRYIGIIKNRVEVLKQLVDEFFRYSVIITTENDVEGVPIIINDVLEESIAAFYTALNERDIVPNITMPNVKVIRKLNHSALSRVFSNLLNNAIRYSDGDLDITLLEMGEILFSNTASKLNEVQVGKLFDRFYTVETARKSTGLGLAIAKTLVEKMNGTISAKYENNKLCICISFVNAETYLT